MEERREEMMHGEAVPESQDTHTYTLKLITMISRLHTSSDYNDQQNGVRGELIEKHCAAALDDQNKT